jgi:hypothetical protein
MGKMIREHPDFANISVGAKHSRSKSLVLTNNLSAGMLRPYKIGMGKMTILIIVAFLSKLLSSS